MKRMKFDRGRRLTSPIKKYRMSCWTKLSPLNRSLSLVLLVAVPVLMILLTATIYHIYRKHDEPKHLISSKDFCLRHIVEDDNEYDQPLARQHSTSYKPLISTTEEHIDDTKTELVTTEPKPESEPEPNSKLKPKTITHEASLTDYEAIENKKKSRKKPYNIYEDNYYYLDDTSENTSTRKGRNLLKKNQNRDGTPNKTGTPTVEKSSGGGKASQKDDTPYRYNSPNRYNTPDRYNIPDEYNNPDEYNTPYRNENTNRDTNQGSDKIPVRINIPESDYIPNRDYIPNNENIPYIYNIPERDNIINNENIPNQDNIPNNNNILNNENIPNINNIPNVDNIQNIDNILGRDNILNMYNILDQNNISSRRNIQTKDNIPSRGSNPSRDNIPDQDNIPNEDQILKQNIPDRKITVQNNIPNKNGIPDVSDINSNSLMDKILDMVNTWKIQHNSEKKNIRKKVEISSTDTKDNLEGSKMNSEGSRVNIEGLKISSERSKTNLEGSGMNFEDSKYEGLKMRPEGYNSGETRVSSEEFRVNSDGSSVNFKDSRISPKQFRENLENINLGKVGIETEENNGIVHKSPRILTPGTFDTMLGRSNMTSKTPDTTSVTYDTSGTSDMTSVTFDTTSGTSDVTSRISDTTSAISVMTSRLFDTNPGKSDTISGTSDTTTEIFEMTSKISDTTSGASNTTSGGSDRTSAASDTISLKFDTTSETSNMISEIFNKTSETINENSKTPDNSTAFSTENIGKDEKTFGMHDINTEVTKIDKDLKPTKKNPKKSENDNIDQDKLNEDVSNDGKVENTIDSTAELIQSTGTNDLEVSGSEIQPFEVVKTRTKRRNQEKEKVKPNTQDKTDEMNTLKSKETHSRKYIGTDRDREDVIIGIGDSNVGGIEANLLKTKHDDFEPTINEQNTRNYGAKSGNQGLNSKDQGLISGNQDLNTKNQDSKSRKQDPHSRYEGLHTRYYNLTSNYGLYNRNYDRNSSDRGLNSKSEDYNSRYDKINGRRDDLRSSNGNLSRRIDDVHSRSDDLNRTGDLKTSNGDLNNRTSDLNSSTSDLNSKTNNMKGGTIFLNRGLKLRTGVLNTRTGDLNSRIDDSKQKSKTGDLRSGTGDLNSRTNLNSRSDDLKLMTGDSNSKNDDQNLRTDDKNTIIYDTNTRIEDLTTSIENMGRFHSPELMSSNPIVKDSISTVKSSNFHESNLKNTKLLIVSGKPANSVLQSKKSTKTFGGNVKTGELYTITDSNRFLMDDSNMDSKIRFQQIDKNQKSESWNSRVDGNVGSSSKLVRTKRSYASNGDDWDLIGKKKTKGNLNEIERNRGYVDVKPDYLEGDRYLLSGQDSYVIRTESDGYETTIHSVIKEEDLNAALMDNVSNEIKDRLDARLLRDNFYDDMMRGEIRFGVLKNELDKGELEVSTPKIRLDDTIQKYEVDKNIRKDAIGKTFGSNINRIDWDPKYYNPKENIEWNHGSNPNEIDPIQNKIPTKTDPTPISNVNSKTNFQTILLIDPQKDSKYTVERLKREVDQNSTSGMSVKGLKPVEMDFQLMDKNFELMEQTSKLLDIHSELMDRDLEAINRNFDDNIEGVNKNLERIEPEVRVENSIGKKVNFNPETANSDNIKKQSSSNFKGVTPEEGTTTNSDAETKNLDINQVQSSSKRSNSNIVRKINPSREKSIKIDSSLKKFNPNFKKMTLNSKDMSSKHENTRHNMEHMSLNMKHKGVNMTNVKLLDPNMIYTKSNLNTAQNVETTGSSMENTSVNMNYIGVNMQNAGSNIVKTGKNIENMGHNLKKINKSIKNADFNVQKLDKGIEKGLINSNMGQSTRNLKGESNIVRGNPIIMKGDQSIVNVDPDVVKTALRILKAVPNIGIDDPYIRKANPIRKTPLNITNTDINTRVDSNVVRGDQNVVRTVPKVKTPSIKKHGMNVNMVDAKANKVWPDQEERKKSSNKKRDQNLKKTYPSFAKINAKFEGIITHEPDPYPIVEDTIEGFESDSIIKELNLNYPELKYNAHEGFIKDGKTERVGLNHGHKSEDKNMEDVTYEEFSAGPEAGDRNLEGTSQDFEEVNPNEEIYGHLDDTDSSTEKNQNLEELDQNYEEMDHTLEENLQEEDDLDEHEQNPQEMGQNTEDTDDTESKTNDATNQSDNSKRTGSKTDGKGRVKKEACGCSKQKKQGNWESKKPDWVRKKRGVEIHTSRMKDEDYNLKIKAAYKAIKYHGTKSKKKKGVTSRRKRLEEEKKPRGNEKFGAIDDDSDTELYSIFAEIRHKKIKNANESTSKSAMKDFNYESSSGDHETPMYDRETRNLSISTNTSQPETHNDTFMITNGQLHLIDSKGHVHGGYGDLLDLEIPEPISSSQSNADLININSNRKLTLENISIDDSTNNFSSFETFENHPIINPENNTTLLQINENSTMKISDISIPIRKYFDADYSVVTTTKSKIEEPISTKFEGMDEEEKEGVFEIPGSKINYSLIITKQPKDDPALKGLNINPSVISLRRYSMGQSTTSMKASPNRTRSAEITMDDTFEYMKETSSSHINSKPSSEIQNKTFSSISVDKEKSLAELLEIIEAPRKTDRTKKEKNLSKPSNDRLDEHTLSEYHGTDYKKLRNNTNVSQPRRDGEETTFSEMDGFIGFKDAGSNVDLRGSVSSLKEYKYERNKNSTLTRMNSKERASIPTILEVKERFSSLTDLQEKVRASTPTNSEAKKRPPTHFSLKTKGRASTVTDLKETDVSALTGVDTTTLRKDSKGGFNKFLLVYEIINGSETSQKKQKENTIRNSSKIEYGIGREGSRKEKGIDGESREGYPRSVIIRGNKTGTPTQRGNIKRWNNLIGEKTNFNKSILISGKRNLSKTKENTTDSYVNITYKHVIKRRRDLNDFKHAFTAGNISGDKSLDLLSDDKNIDPIQGKKQVDFIQGDKPVDSGFVDKKPTIRTKRYILEKDQYLQAGSSPIRVRMNSRRIRTTGRTNPGARGDTKVELENSDHIQIYSASDTQQMKYKQRRTTSKPSDFNYGDIQDSFGDIQEDVVIGDIESDFTTDETQIDSNYGDIQDLSENVQMDPVMGDKTGNDTSDRGDFGGFTGGDGKGEVISSGKGYGRDAVGQKRGGAFKERSSIGLRRKSSSFGSVSKFVNNRTGGNNQNQSGNNSESNQRKSYSDESKRVDSVSENVGDPYETRMGDFNFENSQGESMYENEQGELTPETEVMHSTPEEKEKYSDNKDVDEEPDSTFESPRSSAKDVRTRLKVTTTSRKETRVGKEKPVGIDKPKRITPSKEHRNNHPKQYTRTDPLVKNLQTNSPTKLDLANSPEINTPPNLIKTQTFSQGEDTRSRTRTDTSSTSVADDTPSEYSLSDTLDDLHDSTSSLSIDENVDDSLDDYSQTELLTEDFPTDVSSENAQKNQYKPKNYNPKQNTSSNGTKCDCKSITNYGVVTTNFQKGDSIQLKLNGKDVLPIPKIECDCNNKKQFGTIPHRMKRDTTTGSEIHQKNIDVLMEELESAAREEELRFQLDRASNFARLKRDNQTKTNCCQNYKDNENRTSDVTQNNSKSLPDDIYDDAFSEVTEPVRTDRIKARKQAITESAITEDAYLETIRNNNHNKLLNTDSNFESTTNESDNSGLSQNGRVTNKEVNKESAMTEDAYMESIKKGVEKDFESSKNNQTSSIKKKGVEEDLDSSKHNLTSDAKYNTIMRNLGNMKKTIYELIEQTPKIAEKNSTYYSKTSSSDSVKSSPRSKRRLMSMEIAHLYKNKLAKESDSDENNEDLFAENQKMKIEKKGRHIKSKCAQTLPQSTRNRIVSNLNWTKIMTVAESQHRINKKEAEYFLRNFKPPENFKKPTEIENFQRKSRDIDLNEYKKNFQFDLLSEYNPFTTSFSSEEINYNPRNDRDQTVDKLKEYDDKKKSDYEKTKTEYEKRKIDYEKKMDYNKKKDYDKSKMDYDKNKMDYEKAKMEYEKNKMNYKKIMDYEKNKMIFDKNPMNYDKNSMMYDKPLINYDKNPNYDKTPMIFDKTQNYDKNSMIYNKNPINYDKNPINYDKIPKNYDKNSMSYEKKMDDDKNVVDNEKSEVDIEKRTDTEKIKTITEKKNLNNERNKMTNEKKMPKKLHDGKSEADEHKNGQEKIKEGDSKKEEKSSKIFESKDQKDEKHVKKPDEDVKKEKKDKKGKKDKSKDEKSDKKYDEKKDKKVQKKLKKDKKDKKLEEKNKNKDKKDHKEEEKPRVKDKKHKKKNKKKGEQSKKSKGVKKDDNKQNEKIQVVAEVTSSLEKLDQKGGKLDVVTKQMILDVMGEPEFKNYLGTGLAGYEHSELNNYFNKSDFLDFIVKTAMYSVKNYVGSNTTKRPEPEKKITINPYYNLGPRSETNFPLEKDLSTSDTQINSIKLTKSLKESVPTKTNRKKVWKEEYYRVGRRILSLDSYEPNPYDIVWDSDNDNMENNNLGGKNLEEEASAKFGTMEENLDNPLHKNSDKEMSYMTKRENLKVRNEFKKFVRESDDNIQVDQFGIVTDYGKETVGYTNKTGGFGNTTKESIKVLTNESKVSDDSLDGINGLKTGLNELMANSTPLLINKSIGIVNLNKTVHYPYVTLTSDVDKTISHFNKTKLQTENLKLDQIINKFALKANTTVPSVYIETDVITELGWEPEIISSKTNFDTPFWESEIEPSYANPDIISAKSHNKSILSFKDIASVHFVLPPGQNEDRQNNQSEDRDIRDDSQNSDYSQNSDDRLNNETRKESEDRQTNEDRQNNENRQNDEDHLKNENHQNNEDRLYSDQNHQSIEDRQNNENRQSIDDRQKSEDRQNNETYQNIEYRQNGEVRQYSDDRQNSGDRQNHKNIRNDFTDNPRVVRAVYLENQEHSHSENRDESDLEHTHEFGHADKGDIRSEKRKFKGNRPVHLLPRPATKNRQEHLGLASGGGTESRQEHSNPENRHEISAHSQIDFGKHSNNSIARQIHLEQIIRNKHLRNRQEHIGLATQEGTFGLLEHLNLENRQETSESEAEEPGYVIEKPPNKKKILYQLPEPIRPYILDGQEHSDSEHREDLSEIDLIRPEEVVTRKEITEPPVNESIICNKGNCYVIEPDFGTIDEGSDTSLNKDSSKTYLRVESESNIHRDASGIEIKKDLTNPFESSRPEQSQSSFEMIKEELRNKSSEYDIKRIPSEIVVYEDDKFGLAEFETAEETRSEPSIIKKNTTEKPTKIREEIKKESKEPKGLDEKQTGGLTPRKKIVGEGKKGYLVPESPKESLWKDKHLESRVRNEKPVLNEINLKIKVQEESKPQHPVKIQKRGLQTSFQKTNSDSSVKTDTSIFSIHEDEAQSLVENDSSPDASLIRVFSNIKEESNQDIQQTDSALENGGAGVDKFETKYELYYDHKNRSVKTTNEEDLKVEGKNDKFGYEKDEIYSDEVDEADKKDSNVKFNSLRFTTDSYYGILRKFIPKEKSHQHLGDINTNPSKSVMISKMSISDVNRDNSQIKVKDDHKKKYGPNPIHYKRSINKYRNTNTEERSESEDIPEIENFNFKTEDVQIKYYDSLNHKVRHKKYFPNTEFHSLNQKTHPQNFRSRKLLQFDGIPDKELTLDFGLKKGSKINPQRMTLDFDLHKGPLPGTDGLSFNFGMNSGKISDTHLSKKYMDYYKTMKKPSPVTEINFRYNPKLEKCKHVHIDPTTGLKYSVYPEYCEGDTDDQEHPRKGSKDSYYTNKMVGSVRTPFKNSERKYDIDYDSTERKNLFEEEKDKKKKDIKEKNLSGTSSKDGNKHKAIYSTRGFSIENTPIRLDFQDKSTASDLSGKNFALEADFMKKDGERKRDRKGGEKNLLETKFNKKTNPTQEKTKTWSFNEKEITQKDGTAGLKRGYGVQSDFMQKESSNQEERKLLQIEWDSLLEGKNYARKDPTFEQKESISSRKESNFTRKELISTRKEPISTRKEPVSIRNKSNFTRQESNTARKQPNFDQLKTEHSKNEPNSLQIDRNTMEKRIDLEGHREREMPNVHTDKLRGYVHKGLVEKEKELVYTRKNYGRKGRDPDHKETKHAHEDRHKRRKDESYVHDDGLYAESDGDNIQQEGRQNERGGRHNEDRGNYNLKNRGYNERTGRYNEKIDEDKEKDEGHNGKSKGYSQRVEGHEKGEGYNNRDERFNVRSDDRREGHNDGSETHNERNRGLNKKGDGHNNREGRHNDKISRHNERSEDSEKNDGHDKDGGHNERIEEHNDKIGGHNEKSGGYNVKIGRNNERSEDNKKNSDHNERVKDHPDKKGRQTDKNEERNERGREYKTDVGRNEEIKGHKERNLMKNQDSFDQNNENINQGVKINNWDSKTNLNLKHKDQNTKYIENDYKVPVAKGQNQGESLQNGPYKTRPDLNEEDAIRNENESTGQKNRNLAIEKIKKLAPKVIDQREKIGQHSETNQHSSENPIYQIEKLPIRKSSTFPFKEGDFEVDSIVETDYLNHENLESKSVDINSSQSDVSIKGGESKFIIIERTNPNVIKKMTVSKTGSEVGTTTRRHLSGKREKNHHFDDFASIQEGGDMISKQRRREYMDALKVENQTGLAREERQVKGRGLVISENGRGVIFNLMENYNEDVNDFISDKQKDPPKNFLHPPPGEPRTKRQIYDDSVQRFNDVSILDSCYCPPVASYNQGECPVVTEQNIYPWIGALNEIIFVDDPESEYRYKCSGVVVNSYLFLTSEDCVMDNQRPAKFYQVVVGSMLWGATRGSYHVVEKFIFPTISNGLVLLKVTRKFPNIHTIRAVDISMGDVGGREKHFDMFRWDVSMVMPLGLRIKMSILEKIPVSNEQCAGCSGVCVREKVLHYKYSNYYFTSGNPLFYNNKLYGLQISGRSSGKVVVRCFVDVSNKEIVNWIDVYKSVYI